MALAWSDVETRASRIFNIWTGGGDLAFAREAWGDLTAAGLAEDEGPVARTRSLLRLLALRRICDEFSCAKWQEGAGDDWRDTELELDALALGLLAAEPLQGEVDSYSDEYELKNAAAIAVCETVMPEVVSCLRKAFGGTIGLYRRLSRMASNDNEDDPFDDEPSGDNLAAFDYVDNGCSR